MSGKRRNKSSVIGVVLVILLVCAVASLTVLFSRMGDFSTVRLHNVISLTQSGGDTNVTVISSSVGGFSGGQTAVQNDDSSFRVHDDKTVWQSETKVEIFRLSYENGEGSLTVKSDNGADKLISPGTSNEYEFTLENTGNTALDYNLTMEAWVEGTDLRIPVRASVRDYTNRYLLGSEVQTVDVLELNNVNDNGVLGAGRYTSYTLEWEWPFEQDIDEYDTMLGNLDVNDDMILNIKIITTAEYDENPDDPKVSQSGFTVPQTGDDMPIIPLTIGLAAALLIAAASYFVKRKQDEE